MEYLKIANDPKLWLVSSLMVFVALFQAIIFMKKAYVAGAKMGFTDSQMKTALKVGAIAAVGPSVAIGVALVALMAVIGGPLGWQRLSVVGSLMYELQNADIVLESFGTNMKECTPILFATVARGYAFSAAMWQLNVAFFAPSYDKILRKITKGDVKALSLLTVAALTSIVSRVFVKYYLKITPDSITPVFSKLGVASLVGLVTYVLLSSAIEKWGWKWLVEWTLPLAMLMGMVAGSLF